MAGVMHDKMLYVAFGRRFNPSALTAAREAVGYSQAKLAREVFGTTKRGGGHHNLITYYERGAYKPRMETLRALCDVLGCTVNDLAPKVAEDGKPEYTGKHSNISVVKYHPSWHWGN